MGFFNALSNTEKRIKLSNIDINIVFDGNSLTAGVGGSVLQDFPNYIKDWLTGKAKTVEFHSFGIGGQLLGTMVTNAPTKTYPLVNSSKTNILVLNEDANGLLTTYTPSQNVTLMNQYIDGARTAGYNYIISWNGWYPRLPFDIYVPNSTQLDNQKDYFNLANIIGVLNSDFNIDMRNVVNIGGAEGQNQNAVFFSDYLHLRNLGYNLVANEIISRALLKTFY